MESAVQEQAGFHVDVIAAHRTGRGVATNVRTTRVFEVARRKSVLKPSMVMQQVASLLACTCAGLAGDFALNSC